MARPTTGTYRAAIGLAAAAACLGLLTAPALATTGAKPAPAAPGSHAPALPPLKGTNGPAMRIKGPARFNAAGIPITETTNWSGYIAVPKSGGSQSFTSVTAQYTVPSVNCTPSGKDNAQAFHWTGLDDWTDSTVEKDGVAEFCVSGFPEYYDFYSMVPGTDILEYAVNPGDDIDSSVTYNPATNKYTLTVTDRTNLKWSFTKTLACAGPGTCENSSAEVITEGYPNAFYLGTVDYGAEFYVAATATDAAGVTGSLTNGNWSTVEAIAYGSASHEPTSAPGQIYQGESIDRSAFVVNWSSVN